MDKVNCEIIKDILPLYIDNACSEESKTLIEEHIKTCRNCKSLLSLMKEEEYMPKLDLVSEDNDAVEMMKIINKKMVRKQIIIAVITAMVMGGLWAYFFILETSNPYNNYHGTGISNVEDIMYYFKYAFFSYIVLFIVVIVNLYKAICARNAEKDSNKRTFGTIDLVIDILCGIAMASGLIFQGVLADNNAPDNMGWGSALIIISILSFIIFIINLIVVNKRNLDK